MTLRRVFVFGNGISLDPTDHRLRIDILTQSLLGWLEDEGLRTTIDELVRWANPSSPALNPDEHEKNFEKIAGALQRTSQALRVVQPLARSVQAAQGLQQTSEELALLYRRVVGAALVEIDEAVWEYGQDRSRIADWDPLHDMAEAFHSLHDRPGTSVSIYTLNYDSLLMSAMLQQRPSGGLPEAYDGFPHGSFDTPLDWWECSLSLFPLHGTLGLVWDRHLGLLKRNMEDVRSQRILHRWKDGDLADELPVVVLGDAKDRSILQEPYASYYGQLRLDLGQATEVVVGGYSYGDAPLNRVLAEFLATDNRHRLRDWRPDADANRAEVARVLREALPSRHRANVTQNKIVAQDAYLPDASLIRAL